VIAPRLDDLPHWISELRSGDDERAESAAKHLGEIGMAALADVGRLLQSPLEDERWWAARALAEIPDPGAEDLLLTVLSDPEPAVRQAAALGLYRHHSALGIPALVTALDDPDSMTSDLAANALIQRGAGAVEALLEVMGSGSQRARLGAVRALAEIRDGRAIPALMKALEEDSALMEFWAQEGLERLGVGMMFFKP